MWVIPNRHPIVDGAHLAIPTMHGALLQVTRWLSSQHAFAVLCSAPIHADRERRDGYKAEYARGELSRQENDNTI